MAGAGPLRRGHLGRGVKGDVRSPGVAEPDRACVWGRQEWAVRRGEGARRGEGPERQPHPSASQQVWAEALGGC